MPTKHNGEWGFYTKNGDKFTKLNTGKYGSKTALDVFEDFWAGKLSPIAGVARDVWKGQDFNFQKPTIKGELLNNAVPLPVQTFHDLVKNPDGAPLLAGLILDMLGLNVYTPPPKK